MTERDGLTTEPDWWELVYDSCAVRWGTCRHCGCPTARDEDAGPMICAGCAKARPTVKICTCGHAELGHTHYRAGDDCGWCDCVSFHRPRRRLLRWLWLG